MSESWVLKAIEDAAMKRAIATLSGEPMYMLGLDVRQIHALKRFFEEKTGQDAEKILEVGWKYK